MQKPNRTTLNSGRVFENISIFYRLRNFPNSIKVILPHLMFFPFNILSDNFEKYLKNWFEKAENLQLVYDLYFGTLYNSPYLEHEFLNLIQAIEAYHRQTHNGKYLPKNDYAPIYKTLVEAIPQEVNKDHRESLKRRLEWGHEYSLRKRLQEILRKCKHWKGSLIHNNGRFIEDVVNTRNFLIHQDKDLEIKAKKGMELYPFCQKMKLLLEICFLIELEMPIKTINKIIFNSRRYKNLVWMEKQAQQK